MIEESSGTSAESLQWVAKCRIEWFWMLARTFARVALLPVRAVLWGTQLAIVIASISAPGRESGLWTSLASVWMFISAGLPTASTPLGIEKDSEDPRYVIVLALGRYEMAWVAPSGWPCHGRTWKGSECRDP